ncbi:hypothetical protein HMPREF1547_01269 [Blautia sp. KLE 1732]|nr:hypothetical protein HMPREF1547_01269 [Blautia sp. KLE 1732]
MPVRPEGFPMNMNFLRSSVYQTDIFTDHPGYQAEPGMSCSA